MDGRKQMSHSNGLAEAVLDYWYAIEFLEQKQYPQLVHKNNCKDGRKKLKHLFI